MYTPPPPPPPLYPTNHYHPSFRKTYNPWCKLIIHNTHPIKNVSAYMHNSPMPKLYCPTQGHIMAKPKVWQVAKHCALSYSTKLCIHTCLPQFPRLCPFNVYVDIFLDS